MANHKRNYDPIFVAACTKRPIRFLAKKELFKYKWSAKFFESCGAISVQRDGNDIMSIKKALAALNSEQAIGVFPAGHRAKVPEDEFQLKSGATVLAYKSGSPVLPIYISGTYKPFSLMSVTVGEPFMIVSSTVRPTTEDYQRITEEQLSSKLLDLKDKTALLLSMKT